MRVKSHWFNSGRSKTPPEVASAAAFIIWRIGDNALKTMRQAGFDIDVGPQYFAVLSEFLVFLVQLGDRIAYRHYADEERIAFTTSLANRVAETLAENQARLLGGDMAAHKASFINQLNARTDEYAQFEYEQDGANFSFVRGLGLLLQDVVEQKDRAWVTDQVMAIEAPEAIATLERAMRGLLELEPSRRSARGGAAGD